MDIRVEALRTQAQAEGWSQNKIQSEINRLQEKTREELREGKIKCH